MGWKVNPNVKAQNQSVKNKAILHISNTHKENNVSLGDWV